MGSPGHPDFSPTIPVRGRRVDPSGRFTVHDSGEGVLSSTVVVHLHLFYLNTREPGASSTIPPSLSDYPIRLPNGLGGGGRVD